MKVLVIVAHPNIEQSKVNNRWVEELEKHPNVTIHQLYKVYPDGKIDVEKEQALALEHDRIVFQFPFYWYSTPALLKEWQDTVLTYGWAFGSTGDKLRGKEFVIATSTGGPQMAYQAGGFNHYTLSELFRPLQATANLTGMHYKPIFAFQGVLNATQEQLDQSAQDYVAHILNPELGGRMTI